SSRLVASFSTWRLVLPAPLRESDSSQCCVNGPLTSSVSSIEYKRTFVSIKMLATGIALVCRRHPAVVGDPEFRPGKDLTQGFDVTLTSGCFVGRNSHFGRLAESVRDVFRHAFSS